MLSRDWLIVEFLRFFTFVCVDCEFRSGLLIWRLHFLADPRVLRFRLIVFNLDFPYDSRGLGDMFLFLTFCRLVLNTSLSVALINNLDVRAVNPVRFEFVTKAIFFSKFLFNRRFLLDICESLGKLYFFALVSLDFMRRLNTDVRRIFLF